MRPLRKSEHRMKKLSHIVRTEFDVRSLDDRRRRVNRLVVEYEDTEGAIYRKRFEFSRSLSHQKMADKIPDSLED